MDRAIAGAAVAKATFYKHFPSKDDLIVGWIDRAEEQSATLWPGVDVAEPLIACAHAMIDVTQKGVVHGVSLSDHGR